MKAASKVTPGWWIADGFFNKGGKALVGPFSSREDALTAREAIEPLAGRMDLHVDEYVVPAVDLPTTGTHLGWLTHQGVRSLLAFDFHSEKWVEDASFGAVSRESVEAWMPAVAVPKAALDELRNTGFFATPETVRAKIKSLFAAIDAANGDPQ